MAYQIRNLDHFLKFLLTRFRLSEFILSELKNTTYRRTDRQTDRQTDKHRQRDGQTETDRQTDRQTRVETNIRVLDK